MTSTKPNLKFWITFAAITLLLLPACVGNSGLENSTETTPSDLMAILPPIPSDSAADRNPNEIVDAVKTGMDIWDATSGIMINGTNLEITAGTGGLEWAMYRHNVGFETFLDELQFDLSATGEGAWIAVANYTKQVWDITGPFTNGGTAIVNANDNLSNAGQNVYVVVIAYDGVMVDLASTTLVYENGVVPPVEYQATMATLFGDNCMPCHSATSATSGIILDSYWRSHENADAALAKALNDHAPSGAATITQDEKDEFQSWVDNGKLYGQTITYTADVRPITQNRCSPCHTGGGNSGGVNWDTYADAFAKGDNGWNRIKNDSMPQGGPPLTDSDKDLWFVWTQQGKPE